LQFRSGLGSFTDQSQAQKFGSFAEEEDDELDEESLLETPLDKVEPYGLFKHVLMSMSCGIPNMGL
jgi:importin-7